VLGVFVFTSTLEESDMTRWEQIDLIRSRWWARKGDYYASLVGAMPRDGNLDEEVEAERHDFKVVHWSKLCMFDWDLGGHEERFHVGKVYRYELPVLMGRFRHLKEKHGWGMRFYRTPGGIRMFRTDATMGLAEWAKRSHWLHGDISYTMFTVLRQSAPGTMGGWACRTSPKPGRANDYVARFVVQIGAISDELKPYVEMHDGLIARFQ
jgi:hypothetical protein